MRGAYCLVLLLERNLSVRVGALGAFTFPSGVYVYVGSAQAGVEQRIARHLRRGRHKRWHIDYLLDDAEVMSTIGVATDRKEDECEIAQTLLRSEGAAVVAPGFGSSDCRCRSHLIFFGDADRERAVETVAMQLSLLRCVYPKAL
ncbi:MAG: GIY-YIG nuclease family protein [Methanobacteriota archaeon]|nr:MAG: GIY-YIG nuclease family protein [Euryarchaeota archaeon]